MSVIKSMMLSVPARDDLKIQKDKDVLLAVFIFKTHHCVILVCNFFKKSFLKAALIDSFEASIQ